MRISVVIPVRNRPHTITRSLDSVAAQTLAAHEIIVVDDASTDDTVARVRRWGAGRTDLRVIASPERGRAAHARNTGAAAATGEVIAFLDSDDVWLPEKLERQADLLAAHPGCPAVGCAWRNRYRRRPAALVPRPARADAAEMRLHNAMGGTSMMTVRRDAFERLGGFRTDLPYCEDWDLWRRLAEFGDLRAVPEPLVEYRYDGGGRMTKDSSLILAGYERYYAELAELSPDGAYRRALAAERHRNYAFQFSRNHFRPVAAGYHALAAFWVEPSLRRAREVPRTAARLLAYPLT